MSETVLTPPFSSGATGPQGMAMRRLGFAGLFCKDILQTIASFMLFLGGSLGMIASDPVGALRHLLMSLMNSQDLAPALVMGEMNAVLQVGAGVLLFLATRRGLARLTGIVLILAYIAAQQTGFMSSDISGFAVSILTYLSDVLQMTADSLMA